MMTETPATQDNPLQAQAAAIAALADTLTDALRMLANSNALSAAQSVRWKRETANRADLLLALATLRAVALTAGNIAGETRTAVDNLEAQLHS